MIASLRLSRRYWVSYRILTYCLISLVMSFDKRMLEVAFKGITLFASRLLNDKLCLCMRMVYSGSIQIVSGSCLTGLIL